MLSDPTNGRLSVKEWEVLFNDFHQDFGFALVTGVFDAEDDDEDWG